MDLASSYVESLERLGKQDDIQSFSGEQLLCQLIANGVKEQDLEKKILELGIKELSLAKVEETIRTFDSLSSALSKNSKAGSVDADLTCFKCGGETTLAGTAHLHPSDFIVPTARSERIIIPGYEKGKGMQINP